MPFLAITAPSSLGCHLLQVLGHRWDEERARGLDAPMAESKGWQNEYLKREILIYCSKQSLNYWEKLCSSKATFSKVQYLSTGNRCCGRDNSLVSLKYNSKVLPFSKFTRYFGRGTFPCIASLRTKIFNAWHACYFFQAPLSQSDLIP
jgi:hypothetical protein